MVEKELREGGGESRRKQQEAIGAGVFKQVLVERELQGEWRGESKEGEEEEGREEGRKKGRKEWGRRKCNNPTLTRYFPILLSCLLFKENHKAIVVFVVFER